MTDFSALQYCHVELSLDKHTRDIVKDITRSQELADELYNSVTVFFVHAESLSFT